MRFVIDITPKPQRRHRSRVVRGAARSFVQTYKDPKQRQEEKKLDYCLMEFKPRRPMEGPLLLGVRVFLPIPRSWPKYKQEAARRGEIRPTAKPDLDNLIKHLKDVMNGQFWQDDKQVVEYLPGTGKWYSDQPRWEIELVEA